jgi:D-tyrosyl-tRNA(Tyr) deacylase
MKAVIQRVSEARVEVDGETTGAIGCGILVLLGVEHGDSEKDADWLIKKITEFRIFEDTDGKMNLPLGDVGGELLVVSQFTMLGDCSKGRRPSFMAAAPPAEGKRLYEYFVLQAKTLVPKVETGIFQAMMQVHLVNDGPVTFIIESPKKQ